MGADAPLTIGDNTAGRWMPRGKIETGGKRVFAVKRPIL
jgi:hypothetical protein